VTDDRQLPYPLHDPLPPPPVVPGSSSAGNPLPRRKFQHRYLRHLIFFGLTLITTSFTPALEWMWLGPGEPFRFFTFDTFVVGLWYSLPLLTILGAHEFGHYAFCRRHDVDATLPYFIPAPVPLTGTFGAVIRIREPFPSKLALFDIGVAGPIAGFVALIPFLVIGLAMSEVKPIPAGGTATFGEPLLFKLAIWMQFGVRPEGYDVFLHPMAFAAWFGALATALNLMPFGQLDGGHISYAVLGGRARYVSMATLLAAILLTFLSMSWAVITVMMIVMAVFLGVGHPRVIDENTALSSRRRLVAALAAVLFLLCFTPIPIDWLVSQ
jgi:membrane-associated protease RseP (regulator of RpoE activity)